MSRLNANRGASALAVCALSVALQLTAIASGSGAAPKSNPAAKLDVDERPLNRDVKASTSFAHVVKKVAPSVVNIYSTVTVKEHPMLDWFSGDPILRRFFGDDFGGRQAQPRTHKEQSLGSGVIVSPEGYILTANHVVEGADSVKVALSDGEKEYDAKVIGMDAPTDIAVLKIDTKKQMPAVVMADSDKLEVGDMVLAVGNPFAVGQTVTMGIVSALGRGDIGANYYENFIQTDAAINPGNSGGALVDAEGRLVGINTAILSRTGGFQGVGFAVPSNMARHVLDRLVQYGKVARGYLGIGIQPLTANLAKAFNLPDESSGALVGEVIPHSAADKAGVKDGDVIIEFNGKRVSDRRVLQLFISQTAPDSKVTLRVLRGEPGQKPIEKILTATLSELPEENLAANGRKAPNEKNPAGTDAMDGVEVADLNARTRRQLDIPSGVQGALVVNLDQDSNSAKGGLRQGDVIVEINHQRVRNAEEAVSLTEKAQGDQLLLRVWSQSGGPAGGLHFLVIDNTKHK